MPNFTISKLTNGQEIGYFASQAFFECSTAADIANKIATSPNNAMFSNANLTKGINV